MNVPCRGDEQLLLRPWRLHRKHHCLFQQALNTALLPCSVLRLLWNLQCLWLMPVQSLQCTWEHPQAGFQHHVCLEVMDLLRWPQAALNNPQRDTGWDCPRKEGSLALLCSGHLLFFVSRKYKPLIFHLPEFGCSSRWSTDGAEGSAWPKDEAGFANMCVLCAIAPHPVAFQGAEQAHFLFISRLGHP